MKNLNQSFLYFIFFISLFVTNNNYGQNINDSLRHYYYLATNPKTSNDLPLAYKFYNNFKEKSLLENDTLNAILALRFTASIQKELGYFYDSERSAVDALKLLDNLSENKTENDSKVGIYNHLGIIYRLTHNYNQAQSFFDEALKIAQKPNDSISIYNNKATVYLDQEYYNLAIRELYTAYSKSKKFNNIQTALVLDNLGYAESKLNLQKALPKMLEALNIREEQKNKKGIYTSYRNLAKYYNEKHNIEKSKYYANKAYLLAKQLNSVSYVEDALSNLVALNTDSIIIEYKKIKDSIAKSNEVSRNAYAFNKYNYDKKEKELLKVQLKSEKEKVLYTTIGAFVLLISTCIYFFIKVKHKKDKLKEVYTTETRISQKVHDELANDVYNVMNRIQNTSKNQQEDVLNQLENIYQRTRDISYENGVINPDNNYYHLELKDMLNAYQNKNVSISIIGLNKALFDTIKDHKKIVIERVLKELMTNMKKHSNATNVIITFKKDKRNILITYVDDGVGVKKTEHFKSNGLQNAENRIKNIKGSFNFDTQREKGVAINITFPI